MRSLLVAFAALLTFTNPSHCWSQAPMPPLRFDMGPRDSPVSDGCVQVTEDSLWTDRRGFGWESSSMESRVRTDLRDIHQFELYDFMMAQFDDINRDFVAADSDLVFRADVPNGDWRVTVVIGDMSQAVGSMDLTINGRLIENNLAAWSPGSRGPGNHRRLMMEPYGWWKPVRATVPVSDGFIRIQLSRDQRYFDEMLAKQAREEPAWEQQVADEYSVRPPYQRIGVHEPIYYYIGWPFVHNSIMAVEITRDVELPLIEITESNEQLQINHEIDSPGLHQTIEGFNNRNFDTALSGMETIQEPEAQTARAVLALWLAGRLETEFEQDMKLTRLAAEILESHLMQHPQDVQLAELFEETKLFRLAWQLHEERGHDPLGENHFYENCKAIAYWWNLPHASPLYDQSRLNIARAEHMLHPYMPARGTYRELFRQLEKKYPHNRFVKYHLHGNWDPHGDGVHYYDWVIPDHSKRVRNSPEWVRELYPAFQTLLDWSEWWIRFKQLPNGSIGGGWGDDVEIVGVFGYFGHVGSDVSDVLADGTSRLIEGMWYDSEIDPELGFCLPFTDAEHAAEWTGNTLGMMTDLNYGDPVWIERSMKTGKLIRDLWTAPNDHGHRHFRANFFCAARVGDGGQMNDSWINYRAIRPALAVLRYNRNPTISRLVTELADGWLAAAMSTDRGKPRGVIPNEIAFPSGLIGGRQSPNWYQTRAQAGTDKSRFTGQGYKPYVVDLLRSAWAETGYPRYLEPLRLEYELAEKYGYLPESTSGLRLQRVPDPVEFGSRRYIPRKNEDSRTRRKSAPADLRPGSERWAAYHLRAPDEWLVARRMIEARQGELRNDITKDDIIRCSINIRSEFAWRWPLHTTEASPTDRIGARGMVNPFIVYTGGRIGGPLLEAAVTYKNTTRHFAAAVMGNDSQGLRILYHSLTDDAREISVVPWKLEPGSHYQLVYGPDDDDDETMDRITEQRQIDFPQIGIPIPVSVEPHTTYLIEIEQIGRGRVPELAPDPAIGLQDLRHDWGMILARVHNVGSAPVYNLEVAAWDGDPENGGTFIGQAILPHVSAPIDLDPKTVTIGIPWNPRDGKPHDIYIVLDPNHKLDREITDFNNTAHAMLPQPKDDSRKQRSPTGGRRADRM